VRSERRGRAALVGEVDAGRLRASDSHRSARGAPAEVPRGLRGSEGYRRRGIKGEEQLTSGGPRVEFWRYTGRGREGRAWEASWRQGGADAGLGRGWGAAERPVHGGAEGSVRQSKAATALELGGGCGVAR
jgi:hypothetical protein